MTRLIRSFGEIARKVQRCATIWAILEGNGTLFAQDAYLHVTTTTMSKLRLMSASATTKFAKTSLAQLLPSPSHLRVRMGSCTQAGRCVCNACMFTLVQPRRPRARTQT